MHGFVWMYMYGLCEHACIVLLSNTKQIQILPPQNPDNIVNELPL